jgi:hypothetical protein
MSFRKKLALQLKEAELLLIKKAIQSIVDIQINLECYSPSTTPNIYAIILFITLFAFVILFIRLFFRKNKQKTI